MKRIICSIAVSTAFLLTGLSVSAEEETTWGTIKQDNKVLSAPAAKKVIMETAGVYYFSGPNAGDHVPTNPVAMATRENKRYTIHISAPPDENLGPLDPTDEESEIVNFGVTDGHVYTVWVPIFEKPNKCAVPYVCGPADLGNTPAQGTIIGPVASAIAGPFGLILDGTITRGEKWDQIDGLGDSQWDKQQAEFHFIIQCHGPAGYPYDLETEEDMYYAQLHKQLNYLHGGCNGEEEAPCVDNYSGAFKPVE